MIDDLYKLLTDEDHSLVVENDDIHSFNGRRCAFSVFRAPIRLFSFYCLMAMRLVNGSATTMRVDAHWLCQSAVNFK